MKLLGSLSPIALIALVGCTLGPEPERPATVADAAAFVNALDAQASAEANLAEWWNRFNDAPTNELVRQAIEHNTDLRAAMARVDEARALVGAAFGQRLPQVSASASRQRQKISFDFGGGRASAITTSYAVSGLVTWQVDVFGKLKRQQQAAAMELAATEADREAVLHSVIAETVRLRAQIATLQKTLEIARADTANWQRTYQIIERRYHRGIATALERRLARENLAASRAAEPDVEFQLTAARHALDVLLGRQPGTGEQPALTLSALPPVGPPPVSVPVSLLDRRPDLRSTELRTAAATYDIGVALADLYPDLSINASGGRTSSRLHLLDNPQSIVWSLLLEASWKVFAGGSLRANVDAARARAQAAAAEYAGAVLRALREVEDALVREQTARRRYAELRTREAEALAAEQLATDRYQRGVESLITVLETERRRRAAQRERLATEQTVWEARINLILALGGDWQSDEAADGEPTEE